MRDAANDVCVCSRSAGVPCPVRRLGIRDCAQRGLGPKRCVSRGRPPEYVRSWLVRAHIIRHTARGTQRPVPEGSTHIPRVRALIRSRMCGFAKSHPEGLATRTKLRLLSERPSQAQGPQSSARRRSTRNPLPSSDKSAGRILKCPKDGALSSSPASPPSPACTRRDVPHRGRVYPGCCGLTAASPTSCSPNQDAGQDQDARRLAGLQSPSQETAELDAVHCLLPVGPLQHASTPTHVGTRDQHAGHRGTQDGD